MLKKVFTVCLLSVFLLNPLLIKANDILEKRDNLSQYLQDIEKVLQNYDTKLFTVKKVGDLEVSDHNDEADNFYMMLKLNYKVKLPKGDRIELDKQLKAIKCFSCKDLKKPKRNCDNCNVLKKDEAKKISVKKYEELIQFLRSTISSQL